MRDNRDRGKLRNLKLTIMYDGGRYAGWQRLGGERNDRTIQGILENGLSDLFEEQVKITGAGRTDAGVHALGQTANFRTCSGPGVMEIRSRINQVLPDDIRIVHVEEAAQDFHSRYDAVWKTYEYHLEAGERPGVFRRKYVMWIEEEPDVNRMRDAAQRMVGTHDFRGFSSPMEDDRGTIRTLREIRITEEERQLVIAVTGDGFLYHMVRILAGTLVDIGLGRYGTETVDQIFETKQRRISGTLAPPQGLFLRHIQYGDTGNL